ncbi:MAG: hypothetical protein ACYTFG_15300 [Planctomycetota bacterium]
MGHERTLASIAAVFIFFNASIIIFFGIIYLEARVYSWEEVWVNGDWQDQQVIQWEWLLASVFMLCSFGAAIAGGIATVRAVRFPLAMVSSLLLLVSSMIIVWDSDEMFREEAGQVLFLLVLSLVPVVLLVMSRSAFSDPIPRPGKGSPPSAIDNYGWSTIPGPDTQGQGTGPGGGGT